MLALELLLDPSSGNCCSGLDTWSRRPGASSMDLQPNKPSTTYNLKRSRSWCNDGSVSEAPVQDVPQFAGGGVGVGVGVAGQSDSEEQ